MAAATLTANEPSAARGERIPGLDGLRALAVAGVLLFHADLAHATGGFLGVDLFFVVSGFLITRLLLAERARTGTISLRAFYARRARRILPALLATVCVSSLVASALAPDALPQLRADALPTLLFFVNWHYVVQNLSYFEAMGRQPLLQHCWSLAIEEQFYLLWPLVVLLVTRRGARTELGVLAIFAAIASALAMGWRAAELGFPESQDVARVYFGTDTHAVGLLLGTALAVFVNTTRTSAVSMQLRWGSGLLGCIGIAGTLVLYVVVNETTSWLYPYGFVGATVAAACVVISCTVPGNVVARALDWAPLRWLGERSYGVYLWHWPIYMLTRPGVDIQLHDAATLALRIALTLVAAELSYRALEAPILRRGAVPASTDQRRTEHKPLGSFAAAANAPPAAFAWGALSALCVVGAFVLLAPPLNSATSSLAQSGAQPRASAVAAPAAAARSAAGGQRAVSMQRAVATTPAQWPLLNDAFTVVGDSVVLGARSDIERGIRGAVVYAHIGWQIANVRKTLEHARSAGDLAAKVVVHIGTNGYFTEKQLRSLLQLLADRELVLLINSRVPRPWMAANNALLARVVPEYANVQLLDWHAVADGHPEWFFSDGVHLTPTGARAFVGLVATAGAAHALPAIATPTTPTNAADQALASVASTALPRAEDPADFAPSFVRYPRPLAPATYWHAIARCQTGARWQRPGAFAGGLGIDVSSWRRWGGGNYAPTADQATREQQIDIANRISTQGHVLRNGTRMPPDGFARWNCVAHLPQPQWRLFVADSLMRATFAPGQRGRAVRELQMLLGVRTDGVYTRSTADAHAAALAHRDRLANTLPHADSSAEPYDAPAVAADGTSTAASAAPFRGPADAEAAITDTTAATSEGDVRTGVAEPMSDAGLDAVQPASADTVPSNTSDDANTP